MTLELEEMLQRSALYGQHLLEDKVMLEQEVSELERLREEWAQPCSDLWGRRCPGGLHAERVSEELAQAEERIELDGARLHSERQQLSRALERASELQVLELTNEALRCRAEEWFESSVLASRRLSDVEAHTQLRSAESFTQLEAEARRASQKAQAGATELSSRYAKAEMRAASAVMDLAETERRNRVLLRELAARESARCEVCQQAEQTQNAEEARELSEALHESRAALVAERHQNSALQAACEGLRQELARLVVHPALRASERSSADMVQECASLREQLARARCVEQRAEAQLESEADRRQRLQSRREARAERQAERVMPFAASSSLGRRQRSDSGVQERSPGKAPHRASSRSSSARPV